MASGGLGARGVCENQDSGGAKVRESDSLHLKDHAIMPDKNGQAVKNNSIFATNQNSRCADGHSQRKQLKN